MIMRSSIQAGAIVLWERSRDLRRLCPVHCDKARELMHTPMGKQIKARSWLILNCPVHQDISNSSEEKRKITVTHKLSLLTYLVEWNIIGALGRLISLGRQGIYEQGQVIKNEVSKYLPECQLLLKKCDIGNWRKEIGEIAGDKRKDWVWERMIRPVIFQQRITVGEQWERKLEKWVRVELKEKLKSLEG